MSEAFAETFESEAYDSAGETSYEGESAGEAGYQGEGFGGEGYEAYGEDARSDARRRRERQRQIMVARQQRQAQLRRRQAPPQRAAAPGPPPQPTIAAIRSDVRDLNLETKLDLDSLRRALNEANRRGDRATYSTLLSIAGNQALATYQTSLGNHQVVSAAIRWAPSLLLSSSKSKRGIEGVLLSPPVLAGAAVAAIFISGHFINAPQGAKSISIGDPGQIPAGSTGTMTGIAVDGNGHPLPSVGLTWSSQRGLLTFSNASTGAYTAGTTTGQDFVTAAGGGVTNGIFVTIVAGTTTSGGQSAQDISIADPGPIPTGSTGAMTGIAVDRNGHPLPSVGLTWSSQKGLLTFNNASTGAYNAPTTPGQDFISAAGGGVTDGIFVTIYDPSMMSTAAPSAASAEDAGQVEEEPPAVEARSSQRAGPGKRG